MAGFLQIKVAAFGILLVSPAFAAWVMRVEREEGVVERAAEEDRRLVVEVMEAGRPPRWVYVEGPVDAVPEPGVPLLVGLSVVGWGLRRRRDEGE